MLGFFTYFPILVSAQTTYSPCAVTKIGSPTALPILPPGCQTGIRPKPPAYPSDLRQAMIDKFQVTLNGFGQDQLKWAWEKFWDVSNTKFPALVKGTTLTAVEPGLSEQTGCRTVNMGAYTTEELFKVIIIHELGHVIRNCNQDIDSLKSAHLDALSHEGGVTAYADTACLPGTDRESEDYAEMIAYFLNPDVVEQTVRSCNRGVVPFANNKYPKHFALAKQILGNY